MITEKSIKAAKPHTVLRDKQITGLELYIGKTKKTWRVHYKTLEKRERRLSFGSYPTLSLEVARKIAKKHLADVALGNDPAVKRESETLEQLWYDYHKSNSSQWKPATRKAYETIWRLYLSNTLGCKPAISIIPDEVAKVYEKTGSHQGKRLLSLLSSIYVWSYKSQRIDKPINPASGVQVKRTYARHRIAQPDEMLRLGEGIAAWKISRDYRKRQFARLLTCLVFTGARISEFNNARISDICFESGLLSLSDSKTGKGQIALPTAIYQDLKDAINETPTEHIFAIDNYNNDWRAFKKLFSLSNLRIHDLRRTYASAAFSSGLPMEFVSKILRHNSISTTEKIYASLSFGTGKRMAEQGAKAISQHLTDL